MRFGRSCRMRASRYRSCAITSWAPGTVELELHRSLYVFSRGGWALGSSARREKRQRAVGALREVEATLMEDARMITQVPSVCGTSRVGACLRTSRARIL